jgi:hypothetical protein
MVFDGFGNIIIANQINIGEGPETSIKKIDQNGKVLWNVALDTRQPEPQTRQDPKHSFTEIVSDIDGNVIVTWNYENQIYVKKLDNNGHSIWKEDFIKIGTIGRLINERKTLNTINGIVVLWIDPYNKLILQIVDNDGNLILPDSKYIENVIGFDAVCDDKGNTWIVWGQFFDESIHLVKVNAQGQFEWSQAMQLDSGLITPTNTESGKYNYWLIDDSSGNFIVGWANNWEGGGINLKKVDSEGNVIWSVDEAKFGNAFGSGYRVVSDEAGGVFVFWDEKPSTYGQYINSSGETVWGENGQVINSNNGRIYASESGKGMINADSDGFGGAIILWSYLIKNEYVFYAQRIDNNGIKLWGNDPIAISAPFSAYMNAGSHILRYIPIAISDGINSIYVSYAVLDANYGKSYIQKIEKDGTLPWGVNGIQVGP